MAMSSYIFMGHSTIYKSYYYNAIQFYCPCVEKFALWLIIYIYILLFTLISSAQRLSYSECIVAVQFSSVQFSLRWYQHARESPYMLHHISQKFPKCCPSTTCLCPTPFLLIFITCFVCSFQSLHFGKPATP